MLFWWAKSCSGPMNSLHGLHRSPRKLRNYHDPCREEPPGSRAKPRIDLNGVFCFRRSSCLAGGETCSRIESLFVASRSWCISECRNASLPPRNYTHKRVFSFCNRECPQTIVAGQAKPVSSYRLKTYGILLTSSSVSTYCSILIVTT